MESHPPRIGFIGCGHHASTNLYPSLRLVDVEFTTACDLWEERRAAARRLGVPRVYESAAEMLDSEKLDAVFVSGPPEVHQAMAIEALGRGLHVFVEKPPAPDVSGACAMEAAANASGRILMVGFMKRYAQKYVQAREIAAQPQFGARQHFLMRYSHGACWAGKPDGPWRCLSLMTIHALDLVFHLMGRPVRMSFERAGETGRGAHSFQVLFAFANGNTATLVSNATSPCVTERIEWTGESEAVVVDEVAHLEHYTAGNGIWQPPVKQVYSPNFPLQVQKNNTLDLQGYAGEVRAFVEAIRAGAPSPVPIEDAIAAMKVSELLATRNPGTYNLKEVLQ